MSVVVKNIGALAFTATGKVDTKNPQLAMGEQGTVRITLRGVELVWGPNDSKTLANDLAAEAVAIDSRLRIADTRDGADRGALRT